MSEPIAVPSGSRVHVIGAGPVPASCWPCCCRSRGRAGRPLRRHGHAHPDGPARAHLVADSVEAYSADYIDGDTVAAVFDPAELDQGLAFGAVHLPELMALLRDWEQGFCPLNEIEVALSDLIGSSGSKGVQRTEIEVTRRGIDDRAR